MRTALLALVLTAGIYGPRLAAPLMWDDRPYLVDTSAYDRPIPLKTYASPAYFPLTGELTWRPLATASYAAMTSAFGKNPVPLRLCSLALHLLNALLLALLVLELGLGPEVAVGAAALFLVHPAHIETLMTVTFNKELLATAGILAMLLAHRKGRPGLAAAALTLAVLPKETGILGLPLALLLDFLSGGVKELRRRGRDHAVYAAVAAAYLLVRFGPLKGPGGEANLSALLPWTERLGDAARGFAGSVRVLFAPFGLRIDYFAVPPASAAVSALWAAAALGLLSGTLFLAWRLRRKHPMAAFFVLWPLPVLFLTSNALPTAVLSMRLMAERWLYLPAAGFAAALAWFLRGKPRRLQFLLVFWGLLGLVRARDWNDEVSLWTSLERVYPASAKAVEGRGEALYRAGRTAEAEAAFRKGLDLRGDRADPILAHFLPYAPKGTISWESAPLQRWLGLCALRRRDEREAVLRFRISAALQPSDVFTDRVLAYLAARSGDFQQARDWMELGLKRSPHDEFLLRLAPDVYARRLSFEARFD